MADGRGRQDHYEVLGVTPEAPDEVIRAAHGALVAKHRPDTSSTDGDALKLKRVMVAYAVLGDPVRRRLYDELTRGPQDRDGGERTPVTVTREEVPPPVDARGTARHESSWPASPDPDPEEQRETASIPAQHGWCVGRLAYVGVTGLVAAFSVIGPMQGWWDDGDRWIFAALCLPIAIVNVRARLRDMGADPGDWWFALIPVYNIYFGLRLLLTQGQRGGDRKTVLLVVPVGLVVASMIMAKIHADEPHDTQPAKALDEPRPLN
ncbi:MAG TPA: J domain-containing protein [Solirubrobacteraceae bacterium]